MLNPVKEKLKRIHRQVGSRWNRRGLKLGGGAGSPGGRWGRAAVGGERPPGVAPRGLTLTFDSTVSTSGGNILESDSPVPLQAPALTGGQALAPTSDLTLTCLRLSWRGVT